MASKLILLDEGFEHVVALFDDLDARMHPGDFIELLHLATEDIEARLERASRGGSV